MPFRQFVDEVVSYLVLREFWAEFWPFVAALLLLLGAGVLWPKHRATAKSCLKTAVYFLLFGLVWVMLLL